VTETPKARARNLLVYARPYRRTLVATMITSLVGASMLLAQPVLVRELIANRSAWVGRRRAGGGPHRGLAGREPEGLARAAD